LRPSQHGTRQVRYLAGFGAVLCRTQYVCLQPFLTFNTNFESSLQGCKPSCPLSPPLVCQHSTRQSISRKQESKKALRRYLCRASRSSSDLFRMRRNRTSPTTKPPPHNVTHNDTLNGPHKKRLRNMRLSATSNPARRQLEQPRAHLPFGFAIPDGLRLNLSPKRS
jgi:hypothetical protein